MYRNAVKHVRMLLSFRAELIKYRGACEVMVEWMTPGEIAKVTLVVPELRLRRTLFISRAELDLLRGDPSWCEASRV